MPGCLLRAVRILVATLLFLVGLAVGLWATWQVIVVGLTDGPLTMLIVAVAGVVAFVMLIAVHEFGHYFAARLAGLRPDSLTVAFVRLEWRGGRTSLCLNTRLFEPAGIVRSANAGVSRRQWAAFVAGGPAANMLSGFLFLMLAQAVNPGPPNVAPAIRSPLRDVALVWPGSAVVSWLNLAGLVSLYLGGSNLIPRRFAGLRSDGGQLLDLAVSWAAAQQAVEPARPTE